MLMEITQLFNLGHDDTNDDNEPNVPGCQHVLCPHLSFYCEHPIQSQPCHVPTRGQPNYAACYDDATAAPVPVLLS